MIKIDTMYELYVYAITTKIQRHKEKIEQYNEDAKGYLPHLDVIKPLVERHVNFYDLLNGKVKSLPDHVLHNASSEIKFANVTIKHYYELREPMVRLAEEIRLLEAKKINIKLYKEIIRKCNNKIGKWLIDTGDSFYNPFFGAISLRHKENVNRVNWNKSNKRKQEIIDAGGIPFVKEDKEKCDKAGIPYHGIEWINKDYPNGLLVVFWQLHSFVRQKLNENISVRFSANKSKYGIVIKLSEFYLTNPDYSKFVKLENYGLKKQ